LNFKVLEFRAFEGSKKRVFSDTITRGDVDFLNAITRKWSKLENPGCRLQFALGDDRSCKWTGTLTLIGSLCFAGMLQERQNGWEQHHPERKELPRSESIFSGIGYDADSDHDKKIDGR
jgi:hypothetical protein